VLPVVAFDVVYLKFLGLTTPFSPYYSWDARLAFDTVVVRRGRQGLEFAGVVQSAGTENFGSRIGVGGAGYILTLSFRQELASDASVAMGLSHLSTHLTRDLDEKTEEARARRAPIPDVEDPSEYNAPFVEWRRRFATARFVPEVTVGVAPVNMRLSARSRGWNRRPFYADTRWRLWAAGTKRFVVETVHEVGAGPLNRFIGAFEVERPRSSSRFQVFASFSPGEGLHVSPRLGGVRDGLAVGVRLMVRTAGE
jgi:hypothetical protein